MLLSSNLSELNKKLKAIDQKVLTGIFLLSIIVLKRCSKTSVIKLHIKPNKLENSLGNPKDKTETFEYMEYMK